MDAASRFRLNWESRGSLLRREAAGTGSWDLIVVVNSLGTWYGGRNQESISSEKWSFGAYE